jgi:hypothetical protein
MSPNTSKFFRNQEMMKLSRSILTIFTGFSIDDVVPGDVLVGRRGVCVRPEITRQAEQTEKNLVITITVIFNSRL